MISQELKNKLRQKYNPDGSNLRRAQLRMLDMLIYIDSVCNEIGIDYWLDSGTLIGAVRHGGFLPWDDDLDIGIRYEDEKRLRQHLTTHPHKQYVLQDHSTDKGYWGRWLVLRDLKSEYIKDEPMHNLRTYRGVQIDIFPYEKNINPKLHVLSAKLQYNRIQKFLYQKKCKRILDSKYWVTFNMIVPCLRFFSKILRSNRNVWKYSYCIPFFKPVKDEHLFPISKIIFEGRVFSAPNKPVELLKNTYGEDVMEMPPENKIITHNVEITFID